jgi:hypothetical protein
LPRRSLIALVVSVSFSREKVSPGLELVSAWYSASGRIRSPVKRTPVTVYFSPSVMFTVM